VLAQRSRWAIEIIDEFGMMPIDCRMGISSTVLDGEEKKEKKEIAAVFIFQFRDMGPSEGGSPQGRTRGRRFGL